MLAMRFDPPREPHFTPSPRGGGMQEWDLATDARTLQDFLTYLFSNYWDQMVYGAVLDGAAYELMCPRAPTEISLSGGWLTVSFDGPHFHLRLAAGDGGDPLRAPSRAWIFRRLDEAGAPISWGFEMRNGAGENMVTIFFATPFVTNAEILEKTPRWERLAMWRDIARVYLGREPEAFDESGSGYAHLAS